MKFKKTNGKHAYHGKRNSRWQRKFSKLGIKKDYGLEEVFNQIANERRVSVARQSNAYLR